MLELEVQLVNYLDGCFMLTVCKWITSALHLLHNYVASD